MPEESKSSGIFDMEMHVQFLHERGQKHRGSRLSRLMPSTDRHMPFGDFRKRQKERESSDSLSLFCLKPRSLLRNGDFYFSVHPFRKLIKAFWLSFISVVDLCITGDSFDGDNGAFRVDLLIQFVEHFIIALFELKLFVEFEIRGFYSNNPSTSIYCLL